MSASQWTTQTKIHIACTLATLIAASLSACGGTSEPPPNNPTNADTSTKPADPTPTPTAKPEPTPTTATTTPPPEPTAAPVATAPPAATTPAIASAPDTGGCPAGMVRIKGGSFKLAAVKTQVSVKDYCLDVNLVSTDQYAECVKGKKCNENLIKVCDPSTYGQEGKGNLPMICVDFPQAQDYCKAQNKRLPTTEEWEWAARGGAEGRTYPWGNDAPTDQLCWSGITKRDGPCPISSFPKGANPQGILDLSGNIYQWVTSGNDVVSNARFGRGGSWKDKGDEVKTSHSFSFKTTYRCGFLGIRCASAAP